VPLDGDWDPDYNGWTIRVEPSRRIAAQWMGWSEQRRDAYRQLAADVAYDAITAIQGSLLHTRRMPRWHTLAWVFCFFRKHQHRPRTILITIYKIEFHDPDCDPDPDPRPGASAPRPLDPLILEVSGAGRLYTVDRVKSGVLPLLPRRNINRDIRTLYTQYVADNAAAYSCEIVEQLEYRFSKSTETGDNPSFHSDRLRPHADAEEPSPQPSPWEIYKSSQYKATLSIGCAPFPIGMLSGIELFAQIPLKGAEITDEIIIAADAQYGFSLPTSAFDNPSSIYMRPIRPSGLP
jgi:hypothetical protein